MTTAFQNKILLPVLAACLLAAQTAIAAPTSSLSLLGTTIHSSGRNSAIILNESSGKQ